MEVQGYDVFVLDVGISRFEGVMVGVGGSKFGDSSSTGEPVRARQRWNGRSMVSKEK